MKQSMLLKTDDGTAINITEGEFKSFQMVRRDGQHNMFSPFARKEANLDKYTWQTIMSHYEVLLKVFGEIN